MTLATGPAGRGDLGSVADAASLAVFFARYARIVLVANSDDVDIAGLETAADETLFVFFNKVYKVLDRPFDRPSILVARSSPAGANIVYRREVADVVRLLPQPAFLGILNVKAGGEERLSEAPAFGGVPVAHLDLVPALADFYPATHLPTSGFAMAMFLVESVPATTVVLAGFTARRSAEWKLFHDHDWTFEQIVLRLLHRSGRLSMQQSAASVEEGMADAVARRFPDLQPHAIAAVTSEVLSERLETANIAIDGLIKATRLPRGLAAALRRLRPASRKERLRRAAGERPRS